MSIVSTTTLKTYFNTGDYPTESNFVDLIDTLYERTISPPDISVYETVGVLRVADAPTGDDPLTAITKACACANDGGHGVWTWDADETATDNTGVYVKPADISGPGRWVRLLSSNTINVRWFGACGVDGVDYTDELDAARDYLLGTASMAGILYFPIGIYAYTGNFELAGSGNELSRITIQGEGGGRVAVATGSETTGRYNSSWLEITTTSPGPALSWTFANDPNEARGEFISLRDMAVCGKGADCTAVVYFEDITSKSDVRSCFICAWDDAVDAHGIWCWNCWSVTFTNVQCSARAGITETMYGDVPSTKIFVPDCTGNGFWIDDELGTGDGGPANMILFQNCQANAFHTGFKFGGTANSKYIDNVAVMSGAVQYCYRGVSVDKGVDDLGIYNLHLESAVEAAVLIGENGSAQSVAIDGGQWNGLGAYGVKVESGAYLSIENINVSKGAAPFTLFHIEGASTRNVWINNTRSQVTVAESAGSYALYVDAAVSLDNAVVVGPTNEWSNYATDVNAPGRIRRLWGNTYVSSTFSGTGDWNAKGVHGVVSLNASSAPVISNITNGVGTQRITFIPTNTVKLDCISGNISSPATTSDYWMPPNQATTLVYDGTEWFVEVEQSRARSNFSTTGSVALNAAGVRIVRCNAASAQTISQIDDGYTGQPLTLIGTTGNTTVADRSSGSNVELKSGSDTALAAGQAMRLEYDGSYWYEI